nr:MAG TPA: hypothetical protein [Caudoviricetes sp.]
MFLYIHLIYPPLTSLQTPYKITFKSSNSKG